MGDVKSPVKGNKSILQDALDQYIANIPPKKLQKRKFLATCRTVIEHESVSIAPEAINKYIEEIEQKTSKRAARKWMTKLLRPVIDVLKQFDGLLETLAQADPMPSAFIWAALRCAINAADRLFNIFDKIKAQLSSLTTELRRLIYYEDLYPDSEVLREELCNTYISVIAFWCRVEKECEQSFASTAFSQMLPSGTERLDKIISQIQEDATNVEKLAVIVEARLEKGEREDAYKEREAAGIERKEQKKEREEQSKFRDEERLFREEQKYGQIRACLGGKCEARSRSNTTRHETNLHNRHTGTCEWILKHPLYLSWASGTATDPSILWVHGPPGSGKSILCSYVIQDLAPSGAALIYHFYEFDNYQNASGTFQLLADRLLDTYWRKCHTISDEVFRKSHQHSYTTDDMKDLIRAIVREGALDTIVFLLDGLDEESSGADQRFPNGDRWRDACEVLSFLVSLTRDHPGQIRLWCSSQYRPCIQKQLQSYPKIDIRDEMKKDVVLFLHRNVPGLGVADSDEQNDFLEVLLKRADANFLWASLMVRVLAEANSPAQMEELIQSDDLPNSLDEYYERIFAKLEPSIRPLACKVFALIVHARRPLRVHELREAVGILQSKDPLHFSPRDMPPLERLEKLFAPLIEVRQSDVNDATCHLFHSTVRTFLTSHPGVIQSNDDFGIRPNVFGNVCLLYLGQQKYSSLLQRGPDGRWIDAEGEFVQDHQFFVYCAKYWDKHVGDMTSESGQGSSEMTSRVKAFLVSPNFQTTIQAQSLWVDAQFNVFGYIGDDSDAQYLRKMLPEWFLHGRLGTTMWSCYRKFLVEWRILLQSLKRYHPGEVDRCWYGALGKHNFLSKMPSRYVSFRFQKEDSQNSVNGGLYFEGLCSKGESLKILRLKQRASHTLSFACEHWVVDIGGSQPASLSHIQTIETTDQATSWSLYSRSENSEGSSKAINTGKASPAAFHQGVDILRIGAQLFVLDGSKHHYTPLVGFESTTPQHPAYFEECATNARYTVTASRRWIEQEIKPEVGLDDTKLDHLGIDFTRLEQHSLSRRRKSHFTSDSLDSSSEEDSEDEESSSESATDSAYETWSECSSVHSGASEFEDDMATPWAAHRDDDEDLAEDSDSSEEEEAEKSSEGGKSDSDDSGNDASDSESDSESEPEVPLSAIKGYGAMPEDDDEYQWDNGSDVGSTGAAADNSSSFSWATVTVFDTRTHAKIFHYEQSLSFMLFESPPILHHRIPLLVWPLSGGCILFGDILAKSYFIRKLRPSSSHTRHIFMKCHFSPCGEYLHIASLEGQLKPVKKKKEASEDEDPPKIRLSLLLSTYKLCAKQPSRSPPILLHRAKTALGLEARISVSKLPYNLTWTPDHLYVACSASFLQVYRIPLFPQKPSPLPSAPSRVSIPVLPIYLPETAEKRQVHYFPGKTGIIFVGSEERQRIKKFMTSSSSKGVITMDVQGPREPPVGCFVDEERDLGGWMASKEAVSYIPEQMGIGHFDRLLEKFDPEGDCELEPYLF